MYDGRMTDQNSAAKRGTRTALITGAASPRGIGRTTAHRLARDGFAIAIWDLDGAACEQLAAEITAQHVVPATGYAVNITDATAVDNAATAMEADLPPVTALVNNAGIASPVPFLEVSAEEWRRVFEVNVHGTYLVTRRFVEGMIAHRYGRIVNISSASAETGGAFYSLTAYSGAKAALLGITRTLARELGPHGITVNSVSPGMIDTDIMGGTLSDERKAVMLQSLPVGRIGTTDDVAAQIAFLVSEDAGFITGVTADVNGGSLIH